MDEVATMMMMMIMTMMRIIKVTLYHHNFSFGELAKNRSTITKTGLSDVSTNANGIKFCISI